MGDAPGRPGPKPATGRFRTRQELVDYVTRRYDDRALQKDIAAEAGVSAALVSDLLQPLKQRRAVFFRQLRLVRPSAGF